MNRPPVRTVSAGDGDVLAALANPARSRLLDILHVHGPATASLLAERTGLAVGSVSHHLKVLAAADLVQEAPELAKDRRERWWRWVSGIRWSTTDFENDPVGAAVSDAAVHEQLQMQFTRTRDWFAQAAAEPDNDYRNTAFGTQYWLRATPAELQQFADELDELLARWHTRELPADGAERAPVLFFGRGFPCQP